MTAFAGISKKRESEIFKENMEEKKDKIVKRGVISGYKYTISDSQVVTIKGDGELENGGEPLKFRFPVENVAIAEGITAIDGGM